MNPTVVKIGGSLMEDRGRLDALCGVLAAHHRERGNLLLCHGGGKDINRNLQWLGEEPRFRDGLRVTSPAAMEVVEMTLSGHVNKDLVRRLQRRGVAACGLSGVDGPILICRPISAELGRVGAVSEVRPGLVTVLLRSGFLPVLSPVSVDAAQESYNVNADDAASAVAVALGAEKLIFISDVPGVLDAAGQTLARLNRAGIETLIAAGAATGGILPKLRSCLQAAETGVGEVHICGFAGEAALRARLEGRPAAGTVITAV